MKTAAELLALAREAGDTEMAAQVAEEAPGLAAEAEERELDAVLAGEYDDRGAVIAVHAGRGRGGFAGLGGDAAADVHPLGAGAGLRRQSA